VVVVSDGQRILADLDRSGDAPLMLARAVPGAAVLVCEQRALAGELAERALGATVHLLDDGFQHLRLARDVDLVVVTPDDLTGRAVPFGRLREPVAALAAADAVILDGEFDGTLGTTASRPARAFRLHRENPPAVSLEPERRWPETPSTAVTVAGIARPDRFATAVRAAGWTVKDALTFADHHPYSSRDLATIRAAAARTGADAILTTAKDAARLMPLRPWAWSAPVGVLPLDVRLEPADEFRSWLLERLRAVTP
jgi:tetraacyldisaccharide 4'-kinase